MIAQPDFIRSYWGKAQPASLADYPGWHPAAYHCLDVAAVGQAILAAKPSLLGRIASLTSIPRSLAEQWMLLAFSLHDLGKFADCFQSIVAERWDACNRRVWEAKGVGPKPIPHGVAGWVLWDECVGETVAKSLRWEPETKWAFESWLTATLGHHGRPIVVSDTSAKSIATPKAISDAKAFAAAAASLICGDPGHIDAVTINEQGMRTASWLVSGLSVMADWIGSNQDWFCYSDPNLSLEEYWQVALNKAEDAVVSAGLMPIGAAKSYGLAQALNLTGPASQSAAATPLQAWASDVELQERGSLLVFLEDLTGSGKTEAALILAHRFMSEGHASGLYWALPTQATANALYGRLKESYRNLFGNDGPAPSLALAHASTDLEDDFMKSRFTPALKEGTGRMEGPYKGDGDTASALCAEWLASDRRRSLLADAGVGTIDQALLAGLPVKFQSLRLAALAGHVLVVDEAHSYDNYTTRLLKQLLAFQASLGGSAIVLSATLTTTTKQELMQAFAEGTGWVRKNYGERVTSATDDFPLASLLSAPPASGSYSPSERSLKPSRGTRRDLPVARLANENAAVASLLCHAQAGRTAVWIRNTVQDAIDGAEALAKAADGIEPWLFHARFALGDRAAIEKRVIDTFGKASVPDKRAPGGVGHILVATQVIEQSLDLDFDAMVTDLAPVDLLIQRAGRLHRHDRGQRPDPLLEIVSPEPVDGAPSDWFAKVFPRASFVYPHPGHLWRTIKLLEEAGLRLASTNPRKLLHEVFDSEEHPAAFAKQVMEWEGKCSAHKATAAARILDPAKGYSDQQRRFYDEARSPTRLGDDQRVVRLAKWEGGSLVPWAEVIGSEEGRAWRMSEIQLRAFKAHSRGTYPSEIEKAASDIEASWSGRAHTALLLPLVTCDGAWTGSLTNMRGESIAIVYSVEKGFQYIA